MLERVTVFRKCQVAQRNRAAAKPTTAQAPLMNLDAALVYSGSPGAVDDAGLVGTPV